jgi:hypothetical protein
LKADSMLLLFVVKEEESDVSDSGDGDDVFGK